MQQFVEADDNQKQISLPDGSMIRLDARSKLRVDFGEATRAVTLLAGRAYFTVQHESRPFIVRSPGGETIDLGALDVLLVENIGNLVCPAEFDIGESFRLTILSVPEGDDKDVAAVNGEGRCLGRHAGYSTGHACLVQQRIWPHLSRLGRLECERRLE